MRRGTEEARPGLTGGSSGGSACSSERDGAPIAKLGRDVFDKVADPRLEEWHLAESAGLLPFYRPLDGSSFEGRPVVMLGSNNYLGLTSDPRVRAAAASAVERYGTGVTGSRLLNGTLPLHQELEELLADWVGAEAALVFSTGYAANLGLIGSLVGPGEAAVVDSAAHASLVDGARYSEGSLRAFRHNRPNSLRRTLRAWQQQPSAGGVLVAVDGIYSMEGDRAPLADIAALCHEFGARFLVDEAHSIGVVGPGGAGTCAEAGIRPDLVMGTFSKALASCGGFIAGSQAVIDYLKITCRPLMFTASGVPAALAAALAAARIAREEDWRREAVAARAGQLRKGLAELGLEVGGAGEGGPGRDGGGGIGGGRSGGGGGGEGGDGGDSRGAGSGAGRSGGGDGDSRGAGAAGGVPVSPIVPVHIGEAWEAGRLWRALIDNGVYTNCAIPPAVPRAILRTSVMATHTEADIDRALTGFERALGTTG